MRKIFLYLLLLFLFISCSCNNSNTLLVMLYNTQKLEYYDSEYLTHQRLNNLSYVVNNSSLYQPDVLILLEVENDKLLQTLKKEYLPQYNYSLITNFNNTSLQIAILSKYPILNANYYDSDKIIRPILHFTVLSHGKLLHIITFHNKSLNEGFELTKEDRIEAVRLIKNAARDYEENDLLILGDANIDPTKKYGDNQSVSTIDINNGILNISDNKDSHLFYFPLLDLNIKGSYEYNNSWYYLDHIYIPLSLRDKRNFTHIKSGIGYTNKLITPYNTIVRYDENTKTGYSDHLPIWTLLKIY